MRLVDAHNYSTDVNRAENTLILHGKSLGRCVVAMRGSVAMLVQIGGGRE